MGVYRTCLISGIDFVFKRHVIAVKWLWFLCSQVKLHLYFSKCGLLTWQDNYAVSTRVFVKMTSVSTTNLLILSNPHSLNYIFTSSNISNVFSCRWTFFLKFVKVMWSQNTFPSPLLSKLCLLHITHLQEDFRIALYIVQFLQPLKFSNGLHSRNTSKDNSQLGQLHVTPCNIFPIVAIKNSNAFNWFFCLIKTHMGIIRVSQSECHSSIATIDWHDQYLV